MFDVVIIGAGVIGSMLARELSRYQLKICVVEKENDVAMGASKANSGIIHGGYDPEPGTLKAKLNTEGIELLYRAAEELHVHHKNNGSMVCAFGEDENSAIDELYARGGENNITQLAVLTGEEARKLEPNLSERITSVLHVPRAGIICPYDLTVAAMGNAMDNGVELLREFEVLSIKKENGFTVTSADGRTVQGKYLMNCAGGGSDRVAEMAGDGFFQIIPRAGEYLLLDKAEGNRVSHTIFQVPSAEGKGILVSPTADGNLLIGPTATKVCTAEDTCTTQEGIDTVIRLAAKSVPSVEHRQVITSFAGVRASERNGDFIIEASKKVENLIHVAAIDSPGLTCCVSIARHVIGILQQLGAVLNVKENWNGERENAHAFAEMTDQEQDAYIRSHPEYGKIVCRCEAVSEGEMRDAIRRNPPAVDLDGVKRRTRGGMGRCQGGFCSPYVLRLIAEERGVSVEQITKKGGTSYLLTEKL